MLVKTKISLMLEGFMRIGFVYSRKDNKFFKIYKIANDFNLLDDKVNIFLFDIVKDKFLKSHF